MSKPVIRPEIVKQLISASRGEREAVAAELGATPEELARVVAGWLGLASLALDGTGQDPAALTYADLKRISVMGEAAEMLIGILPAKWIATPGKPVSDWLKVADPALRQRAERILRNLADVS